MTTHSSGYHSRPGQEPPRRRLFKKNLEPATVNKGNLLRLLVPTRTVFSLLVLIILYPILTLAVVSLLEPIIDYSLLFLPFAEHTQIAQFTALPWIAVVKFLLFLPLAVLSFGLTLFKLTTEYHIAWASHLPIAHPKHCRYEPLPQASSFALLKWQLYRFGKIFSKPLLLAALISGILFGLLWLLQTFQKSYTLIFEILFVLVFFALLSTTFYALIALFEAIKVFFMTNLGSTASILEPRQPAKQIFLRVQRLYAYSGWQWFVFIQELLVYATVIFSLWYMGSHFAVNQLYSLNLNLLKLFLLGFILLVQYIVLLSCKFYTYTDSLSNYYETILG